MSQQTSVLDDRSSAAVLASQGVMTDSVGNSMVVKAVSGHSNITLVNFCRSNSLTYWATPPPKMGNEDGTCWIAAKPKSGGDAFPEDISINLDIFAKVSLRRMFETISWDEGSR